MFRATSLTRGVVRNIAECYIHRTAENVARQDTETVAESRNWFYFPLWFQPTFRPPVRCETCCTEHPWIAQCDQQVFMRTNCRWASVTHNIFNLNLNRVMEMQINNYFPHRNRVTYFANWREFLSPFFSCLLQVFKNYLTFCGIGITNVQLFEISVQEFKRNQVSL